nr:hypothetical protein [Fulvimarina sp. 2208YS6-2-32]
MRAARPWPAACKSRAIFDANSGRDRGIKRYRIDIDPVSTKRLRPVQGLIGRIEQFHKRDGGFANRDTDADGYISDDLAEVKHVLVDRGSDSFGNGRGSRNVQGRQKHNDLLTSEPRDRIDVSDFFFDCFRNMAQNLVADRVPPPIVEALEVVDIDDQQAGSPFQLSGRVHGFRDGPIECPAIQETRQRIGDGKPFQCPRFVPSPVFVGKKATEEQNADPVCDHVRDDHRRRINAGREERNEEKEQALTRSGRRKHHQLPDIVSAIVAFEEAGAHHADRDGCENDRDTDGRPGPSERDPVCSGDRSADDGGYGAAERCRKNENDGSRVDDNAGREGEGIRHRVDSGKTECHADGNAFRDNGGNIAGQEAIGERDESKNRNSPDQRVCNFAQIMRHHHTSSVI